MAAIPPSASQCSILEIVHGSHIRQHEAFKLDFAPRLQSAGKFTPLCALSSSGCYLAVTVNDGYVSVYER